MMEIQGAQACLRDDVSQQLLDCVEVRNAMTSVPSHKAANKSGSMRGGRTMQWALITSVLTGLLLLIPWLLIAREYALVGVGTLEVTFATWTFTRLDSIGRPCASQMRAAIAQLAEKPDLE